MLHALPCTNAHKHGTVRSGVCVQAAFFRQPCLKTGSATGSSASSWGDRSSRRSAHVSNTKTPPVRPTCDRRRRKQTASDPGGRRRTRERRTRSREVTAGMSACLRVAMETSVSWHPADCFPSSSPSSSPSFNLRDPIGRFFFSFSFSGKEADVRNQDFHSEVEIKPKKKKKQTSHSRTMNHGAVKFKAPWAPSPCERK